MPRGRVVLLFDLDDTLIPEDAADDTALLTTCRIAEHRIGVAAPRVVETVKLVAKRLWKASPAYSTGRVLGLGSRELLWGDLAGEWGPLAPLASWIPQYRSEVWSSALREHDAPDHNLALTLARAFPKHRRQLLEPFADAKIVLDRLGSNPAIRLGLLTNGASTLQREKVRCTGLVGVFENCIISSEVGVGKPHPGVFEAALERFNAAPSGCVMIGNSLRRDIAGAQAVGVTAIWLNRAGMPKPDFLDPDAEIRSLSELPAILQNTM